MDYIIIYYYTYKSTPGQQRTVRLCVHVYIPRTSQLFAQRQWTEKQPLEECQLI